MIIKWLVDLVFRPLLALVDAVLPDWDPVNLTDPASAIAPHIGKLFAIVNWSDQYLPTKQAITALILLFSLYGIRVVYGYTVKVLTMLHILGGDGAG